MMYNPGRLFTCGEMPRLALDLQHLLRGSDSSCHPCALHSELSEKLLWLFHVNVGDLLSMIITQWSFSMQVAIIVPSCCSVRQFNMSHHCSTWHCEMESLLWGCAKSAEACEGREGRRVMTWLSALLSTESFRMTVSDTRASATLGVQLGVRIRGVAYEDLRQVKNIHDDGPACCGVLSCNSQMESFHAAVQILSSGRLSWQAQAVFILSIWLVHR